jgi:hypothetical protein
MRTKTLLLTFLFLAGLPVSALAQKTKAVLLVLPAPSEWKGHNGVLDVTAVSNGVIQGTFTSNDTQCGQTAVPVVGKLAASQKIAFAAMLPACKTIMAWRGTFSDRAIGTGLNKTSIAPDGTVVSSGLNGDLFSRTK